MSAAPPSGPGGTADRVRCAYCGANNFPAAPVCWQCQRPLRPLRAGSLPSPAPSPTGGTLPSTPGWVTSPAAGADLGLAPKAAAALGLLFPWAGLPIGLAFLMLDDPRRARLGWIAIGWSVAGTVLSAVVTIPPLLAALPLLKSLLPHPGGLPGGGVPPDVPSLGGEQVVWPRAVLPYIFFGACAD